MKKMRAIILASTSPRRRELLAKTGLSFMVEAPIGYEEDMTLKMKPLQLAKALSRGKAETVAKNHKDAIVIGADTFVALHDEVLGKPHTPEKAKLMLQKVSGKSHLVITGFTIIDTKTGKSISRAIASKVYFKKMSEKEIDGYIRTGEPLDKAAGYALQERGSVFIRKIEGDFLGVVGLPIYPLVEELKKFGVEIF
jgi:septum formation protein